MNMFDLIEAEKKSGGILDMMPDEYDLRAEDALSLSPREMDRLDAIYYAYLFGYINGVKAEKGED